MNSANAIHNANATYTASQQNRPFSDRNGRVTVNAHLLPVSYACKIGACDNCFYATCACACHTTQPAQFVGMIQDGDETFALYTGVTF